MKKSLFAICAIAACFASCSKVVDSTTFEEPISFEGYIGRDAITRGKVIESDAVNEVMVNAFIHLASETNGSADFVSNFMENQLVTKKEGTETWGYKPNKYWPAADRTIDFVAWIDPEKDVTDEDEKKVLVDGDLLTLTVPKSAQDQVDLMVSDPQLDKNGSTLPESVTNRNQVPLTFRHLLSRIRFEINTTQLPEDGINVVTLEELSLNGVFASKGTVDMRAAKPMVTASTDPKDTTKTYWISAEDLKLAKASDCELTNTTADNMLVGSSTYDTGKQNAYLMLIPNNAHPDYIKLSYKVTTYEVAEDGETPTNVESGDPVTNTAKFRIDDVIYEPGKAYVYKFSIKMDAIEFTVDVEDWMDDNDEPNKENENNIVNDYNQGTTGGNTEPDPNN